MSPHMDFDLLYPVTAQMNRPFLESRACLQFTLDGYFNAANLTFVIHLTDGKRNNSYSSLYPLFELLSNAMG